MLAENDSKSSVYVYFAHLLYNEFPWIGKTTISSLKYEITWPVISQNTKPNHPVVSTHASRKLHLFRFVLRFASRAQLNSNIYVNLEFMHQVRREATFMTQMRMFRGFLHGSGMKKKYISQNSIETMETWWRWEERFYANWQHKAVMKFHSSRGISGKMNISSAGLHFVSVRYKRARNLKYCKRWKIEL